MIEVPNENIFVAIAAYREPELRQTIDHCIAMADQSDRLRFGVCLQYELEGPPETRPDCLDRVEAEIRLDAHHWADSKGGCWARNRAQRLFDGEGFTLQIDAHMRMAPDWDRVLIDEMRSLPSDKPLITAHCPLYDVVDGVDVIPPDVTVPVTVFERISHEGWVWHPGIDRPDVPASRRPTRAVSGGLVFTLGIWTVEVHQDPDHLYTGEELALTIRSFTHGYDLWNPPQVVAWHRYHPDGNRKFIYDGPDDEVSARHRVACRRLRTLHRGDPDRILGRFGVGPARTVSEYHGWAGIDVASWTISDDAQNGVTPERFTPPW